MTLHCYKDVSRDGLAQLFCRKPLVLKALFEAARPLLEPAVVLFNPANALFHPTSVLLDAVGSLFEPATRLLEPATALLGTGSAWLEPALAFPKTGRALHKTGDLFRRLRAVPRPAGIPFRILARRPPRGRGLSHGSHRAPRRRLGPSPRDRRLRPLHLLRAVRRHFT